ncbi:hypothetical protein BROSI_A2271 [Candidatus Brocadia sinica JPN1]|uniref:Uncharacterized protein n=1 Tax=Candidatus Brocadia sinica JPN1 TaxID=1197129 RepID=A0ABQ0JYG4_9BACT|nr:hypothetical protein BROSI_A2271 [Candidatus Brocadia sinica JPN1]GIK13563.1 MAG: hypothetical protein BroJett002_22700 [Candidatus Brocadia sinica]GJQ17292.1 MAG: hypothetical protein HBSIN01_12510 [Candidatus Brocadia sinica]
MPQSHTDNEKEKNEFTPRFVFSLNNKNRKDYMQDGTEDKAYE